MKSFKAKLIVFFSLLLLLAGCGQVNSDSWQENNFSFLESAKEAVFHDGQEIIPLTTEQPLSAKKSIASVRLQDSTEAESSLLIKPAAIEESFIHGVFQVDIPYAQPGQRVLFNTYLVLNNQAEDTLYRASLFIQQDDDYLQLGSVELSRQQAALDLTLDLTDYSGTYRLLILSTEHLSGHFSTVSWQQPTIYIE